MSAVEVAVAGLAGVPDGLLDAADEQALEAVLGRLARPVRQLEGARARFAAVAQARRVAATDRGPRSIARREHQRRLADQQRLSRSEAKRVVEAGDAARDHAATGQALKDGELDAAQAQLIARILAEVDAGERRDVESELLSLAAVHDAVAFGRKAREVLARVRPAGLARDAKRQHRARRLRATDTPDGGFAFSGLLYGTAAEQARVALRAFRRPDTPGEHRTPEQRSADAFEQLCEVALRAGEAPTQHGVRPQVVVVFTAEQFARLEDDATNTAGRLLASGQPVCGANLRHLVDGSQLLRLVVDADGAPMEVSTKVRTVPLGLWRALQVRDQGCVWPGCDAPPAWCDVAHGQEAFAEGGELSVDNALLLCRRHHRRFDASDRRVQIEGDTVTFPTLFGAVARGTATGSTPGEEGPSGGQGPQQPALISAYRAPRVTVVYRPTVALSGVSDRGPSWPPGPGVGGEAAVPGSPVSVPPRGRDARAPCRATALRATVAPPILGLPAGRAPPIPGFPGSRAPPMVRSGR